MGKAREREATLMTYWFLTLALLAALVLIVAVVKVGGEARSHVPATVSTEDGSASLGLALRQP